MGEQVGGKSALFSRPGVFRNIKIPCFHRGHERQELVLKPPPFDYARPATIEEALRLIECDTDAKIIAGGQSLIPLLNFRLATPTLLVDINRIAGLDRIELVDGQLHIGALVRWRDIEKSDVITRANPLLAEGVNYIAHYQIRNRGTAGGSCAHADPSAEFPAIAVACDAKFVLQSVGSSRTLVAVDFFEGPLQTALMPTEILTEIQFPSWPPRRGWGFEEISPRRGDFALVGAAVLVDGDDAGECVDARVVVFGTAAGASRLRQAEASLLGKVLDTSAIREAARLALEEVEAQTDIHGSAAYRRSVAGVLVERALNHARTTVISGV